MFIKNIKNFSGVFSLLSSFKALPKELIISLSGISEDDFENLVKKKAIFQVKGGLYSISKDSSSREDLLRMAWAINEISANNSEFMISSINPLTVLFTVKQNNNASILNCIIDLTEENLEKVKLLDFSEFKLLFFVTEKEYLKDLIKILDIKCPVGMILVKPKLDKNGEKTYSLEPDIETKKIK